MQEYLIKKRKGILFTLFILVVFVPSIISFILFLNNDTDFIMVSGAFFILGLIIALMIIFIPYFLNKKLITFVKSKTIQDFFSKQFKIVETKSKTDAYFVTGFYKDYIFNFCFRIDNRSILSLQIELVCVVDSMRANDEYRIKQFIQKQDYRIIPTSKGIEYTITFDNGNPLLENEINEICDSLIINTKQFNNKI
jgi:hypothetical protein